MMAYSHNSESYSGKEKLYLIPTFCSDIGNSNKLVNGSLYCFFKNLKILSLQQISVQYTL